MPTSHVEVRGLASPHSGRWRGAIRPISPRREDATSSERAGPAHKHADIKSTRVTNRVFQWDIPVFQCDSLIIAHWPEMIHSRYTYAPAGPVIARPDRHVSRSLQWTLAASAHVVLEDRDGLINTLPSRQ